MAITTLRSCLILMTRKTKYQGLFLVQSHFISISKRLQIALNSHWLTTSQWQNRLVHFQPVAQGRQRNSWVTALLLSPQCMTTVRKYVTLFFFFIFQTEVKERSRYRQRCKKTTFLHEQGWSKNKFT